MKKIVTSVFVVLSALTACTVQNQGQSYDEVYYSPNDKAAIVESGSPAIRKSTKQVVVKTDSSNIVGSYVGRNSSNPGGFITKSDSGAIITDPNNFNYDAYYDYSYASRIRRFQYSPFNDYYNDYYTNRYWYDYNPGYWGSSIYSNWGMGMGMSYYMSPFSMSWGMHSPFSPFYNPFYDPFYDPYGYYSPFGYNSFGMGYNMGYYDGRYGLGYGGYGGGIYGYGGGYNNTFDKNSAVYYGPKRDLSSSNGPIPSERTAFSQRYNALSGGGGGGATSISSPSNGREIMNSGTSGAAISNGAMKVANANTGGAAGSQREAVIGNRNLFGSTSSGSQPIANTRGQLNRNDLNRYINQNNNQVKKPDSRSVQQQQGGYFKDKAIAPSNSGNIRYTKPQQVANPQQYYNPSNSRPRSSNEYTSPGYRNPGQYNSTPQRSLSDPSRYAPPKVNQTPAVNASNGRAVSNYNNYRQESTPSYNAPSRSTYTAPSQTYSAPAQTYSAPTQTYSAPSGGNARESSSGSSSSGGSVSSPRR